MQLILKNNLIEEPIEHIIYELKREASWNVFADIQRKENYLRVTCPFHKDGNETHPSCSIFTDYNSDDIVPGTFHCFTCGAKGQLYQLVAQILDITNDEAIDWIISKFGVSYDNEEVFFPKWDDKHEEQQKYAYLDESILDQYKYYHPYMQQRKISLEIAKKFSVGWNQQHNTIIFPVWDEHNNLVMITERSIDTKKFYIPSGIEKPVYLLNYAIKDKYKTVIVCEGQIDALVAYSYGFPAIALFGSGTTKYQIDILKKSGIYNYILMYDNDTAGRHGAERFKKYIGKDKFIKDILMPVGRDIADLNKEEFQNILKNNNISLDVTVKL